MWWLKHREVAGKAPIKGNVYRDVAALREHHSDLTSNACHYTQNFGEGDVASRLSHSVAPFGKLTVDAQGACQPVEYPRQGELYFVRDGSGVRRRFGHTAGSENFRPFPPRISAA